ncbi:hypothetical protein RB195_008637 [Necator americanus]|uniref:Uncharacterized protein n=1 Tax=Necator americanus TaxID=51031 RepID=A0ABR1CPK8_NECAM
MIYERKTKSVQSFIWIFNSFHFVHFKEKNLLRIFRICRVDSDERNIIRRHRLPCYSNFDQMIRRDHRGKENSTTIPA